MKFSTQLSDHRARLGLTQAAMADLLGLGLRTYAGWERGDDPQRMPHKLMQKGTLDTLGSISSPVVAQTNTR